MKLSLPDGNSKMGKVLHVNLPPKRMCTNQPCFKRGCYSKKAYRLYPNVRKAWNDTWELLMKDRDRYFREILDAIRRKEPDVFRWHSAGDIPDADYLRRMFALAHVSPGTKFMAFTKQYEILEETVNKRLSFWRPGNLTIVVSAWPRLPMPPYLKRSYPTAWVRDELDPDKRIPKAAVQCSGQCDTCLKCWNLKPGESVVFDKH